MSAHCQVTGRAPGFGNSVSHSQRRTRRRWEPNIQRKTYYVPSEGRRITLRVSAKGIKTIDRSASMRWWHASAGKEDSDGTKH